MAARNDVTGAEIKSRALSAQGRENWVLIFGKKTAFEWMDYLYQDTDLIKDFDGWPGKDGVYLDTPITRADFETRFSKCTIRFLPTLNK